jgi:lipoprotein-anchoring transpeptidase ErfK/SrfK
MRWFFVGVLGVGVLAWGGEQALGAEVFSAPSRPAFSRKAKKAKRGTRAKKRRDSATGTSFIVAKPAPPPPVAAAPLHPVSGEPAPSGEQAVFWAQPQKPHFGVKIRLTPNREATAVGEMRGDTAVAIKLRDGAMPAAVNRGGCRAWLIALPEGYVCSDEVQLSPGYLSDPPTVERATAWQRFRYGVIKVASAVLERAPGQPAQSAGYLRNILHRGDGITVIKELEDRVQVYGKKWLRKMDVSLVTPPALSPISMQTVPPAQRFLVAWAVPAAGETQVALYPPAGPRTASAPIWIPRYSRLWWTDGKASPGRVAVYLTAETRAARGTRPDTPNSTSAPATPYEIDVRELRRLTPAPLPAGLQEGERWIDISLHEQVAVAYVGDQPIFASLVSTGNGTTPPGSFFIYRKYLTQTMANLSGSTSQYDFREVPYAQFFNGRIGLHAVLWHDLLGHPVSHGCVNMSPAAAEQFFSFTKPEMPLGWHTITAAATSAVRATSLRPPPNFRGTRVVVRR